MEKAKKIYELLIFLCKSLYNGSVVIHYNKGDIAKIEKHETLKI